MPYKHVDAIRCNECGETFDHVKHKNPQKSLWNHQQQNKGSMTCGQKRERKDLQAFKDSLTHTSMMEMKQHKTQSQAAKKTSEQNEEMKRKLDALRAECEEIKARNRELMLVTMNLKDNPCVVSAWSKLHPIQDLQGIDLSSDAFRELREVQYPRRKGGPGDMVCALLKTQLDPLGDGVAEVLTRKGRLLQEVHPTSVIDDEGRIFYLDGEVMKMDTDGHVLQHILRVFSEEDSSVSQICARMREGDAAFNDRCKEALSGIHLSASSLVSFEWEGSDRAAVKVDTK